jgi:hypothetical protein
MGLSHQVPQSTIDKLFHLFRPMMTDPTANNQQLAIDIGNLHVELHHRLQIDQEELKRKVTDLEKIAYQAGKHPTNAHSSNVHEMIWCHSYLEITNIEAKAADYAKRLAELNTQAQEMRDYLKRKFGDSP